MQNIAHNMLKQVSCKVKLFYENFLKLFENSEHSAVGTAGCRRARLFRHVKNPLPVSRQRVSLISSVQTQIARIT